MPPTAREIEAEEELREHEFSGTLRAMNRGLVTKGHHILSDAKWAEAKELYPKEVLFAGNVYTLVIETNEPLEGALDHDTEHSFYLPNEEKFAHEAVPIK